ncbi:TPA: hypothetical protein ACF3I9_004385 [Klebsiella aerogenes]
MFWILQVKHVSHKRSEEAYLRVPDILSYSNLYLLIANIQKTHSQGCFLTEDLSGKQIAFILSEIYGTEEIEAATAEDMIRNGMLFRSLDLFWNWEQTVVKLCFDEDSRAAGEAPYFYPYLKNNSYPVASIRNALEKMDSVGVMRGKLTASQGSLVNLPSSQM